MKRLETMLASLALAATAAGGADFNVRTFGAVGDGSTKDTAAVQRALDACAQAGGGRVTVPPGTYLIGSVYLGCLRLVISWRTSISSGSMARIRKKLRSWTSSRWRIRPKA
ncbi:MAG: hypothetical protein J6V72_15940, partial [Kiritimatiellae bacterium]|nr:hypothetical protein [Kiritimatiellia bacterium]